MKTMLLSAALALGVSFVGRAQQPNSAAGVQQVAALSYRVWASNPGILSGQIRILDAGSGRILFEEKSSAASFGHLFNMGSLPDGHYAFVVKIGQRQFRYALSLQTTSQRKAELRADTARTHGALAFRF